MARIRVVDAELSAIERVLRVLASLSQDQASRVMTYVIHRQCDELLAEEATGPSCDDKEDCPCQASDS